MQCSCPVKVTMKPLGVDHKKLHRLELTLKPFDRHTTTESDWIAINALFNRRRAESAPADPPEPLTDTINGFQHRPAMIDAQRWFIWQGNSPIATANAAVMQVESNQHILEFDLYVRPEWRRHGLATELLKAIVQRAQEKARTMLLANTTSTVPAGAAFLTHIGAHVGLALQENQLLLAAVDRSLLQTWIAKAKARAGALEIDCWVGALPAGELDALAVMMGAMNSAPRDDLAFDDFVYTPEILRQDDESLVARGIERWFMVVRDPATGVYAGFTEVFWQASAPETMRQGDTGVMPAYRNRGIGRWLKAAMLEKVLTERPQVKTIRTGNAVSNAAMLKINHELGFTLHKTFTVWQVERSIVEAYLQKETA